jgi:hypothetical protein
MNIRGVGVSLHIHNLVFYAGVYYGDLMDLELSALLA